MTLINSRFSQSSANSSAGGSALTFGVDVSRAPVFLQAAVTNSVAFAKLMLGLARIVRMEETGKGKDHSQYQAWVQQRYLEELDEVQAAKLQLLPEKLRQQSELTADADRLSKRVAAMMPGDPIWGERVKFWRWLYGQNREAWVVLDPIVSVQPDATFFEAFSTDESVYGRVTLPHSAIRPTNEPRLGTTNIDFSVLLEREMARVRSYRPISLTVGSDSVGVSTGVSETVERKIDLPESWVRGLVEVQAALALAPVELSVSSAFVADLIARLEAERERTGPRAFVFKLNPNEPVQVVVEPWGEVYTDRASVYVGTSAREIRVWGRRRLAVLKELLPYTEQVRIRLLDSGLPSFWSVDIDGLSLLIGLSGWSSQDWAGRARFSAFMPSHGANSEDATRAAALLAQHHSMSVDQLVKLMNVKPTDARALLQRLCLGGKAMFDADSGRYRWRELFPEFNLDEPTDAGREERKGVELSRAKAVSVEDDRFDEHGVRTISSSVNDNDRQSAVVLSTDVDGRVTYAQCDCSHFRFHKLRQGPCRHIVATSLV